VTTPFQHQALLYRDAAEFLAGTVPFVRDGLVVGEPVLVAVPGSHVDLLSGVLGDAAAGRVRFADMTEAGRNPGRIIPWVLNAFLEEHAGVRVRIIGEPIWPGRSTVEYPACVQHEALINRAFAGRDATILCPYDATALDQGALSDAERTHPEVLGAGPERVSPRYRPDEVVREYNQPLPPVPVGAARVDFDAAGLALVREFVGRYAADVGLGERRAVDFQLAVNELTTNAVTHGGGRGMLAVWSEPGLVAAEVQDEGRAVQPLSGRVPPAPDRLGGRGLVLVNYVSDLVRVHTAPTGTTVRVYLYA
jgi:anti-sigma regulatory factor (Ser/Thr protein kinase)